MSQQTSAKKAKNSITRANMDFLKLELERMRGEKVRESCSSKKYVFNLLFYHNTMEWDYGIRSVLLDALS
jgi:hypothetical protein